MNEPVFKLSRVSGMPVSDEELVSDLRRVAELLRAKKVTQGQYKSQGIYDVSTQERRFGTWNQAVLRAGLTISNKVDIPDVELFENLLSLWRHYGRQPR